MATTLTKIKWDIHGLSISAAFLAGACNLSCWAIINYFNFVIQTRIFHRNFILMNYPEIISEGLWLAPILALIVFSRVLAVTLTYTVILLITLAGCIYDFVRFLSIGTDAIPSPGWPGFILFGLGMASLIAVSIKVIFHRESIDVGEP
jgi:hypothetical protein